MPAFMTLLALTTTVPALWALAMPFDPRLQYVMRIDTDVAVGYASSPTATHAYET